MPGIRPKGLKYKWKNHKGFENGVGKGSSHSSELKVRTKIKQTVANNYNSNPKLRKIISDKTKEAMKSVSKEVLGYWKGKKKSIETLDKIRGEKHWNWQGEDFIRDYPYEWTEELRDIIRKRDGFICQECGIHQDELQGWNLKLDIHHIDYNKNNLNLDNLISLCRSCHVKTNYNRKYWYGKYK